MKKFKVLFVVLVSLSLLISFVQDIFTISNFINNIKTIIKLSNSLNVPKDTITMYLKNIISIFLSLLSSSIWQILKILAIIFTSKNGFHFVKFSYEEFKIRQNKRKEINIKYQIKRKKSEIELLENELNILENTD